LSILSERTGPDRASIHLSPIKVAKASDVLANELRERILTGEFPVGTGLPAERDLVIQTRMSRTSVREALRILEVQGLISIKVGRTGGAFVEHPGEPALASTLTLLIRGQQIPRSALLEVRSAIEPFCARLAAADRTDQDLHDLDAANAATSDSLPSFVEWHIALARTSHNEMLSGLVLALSRAIHATTDDAVVDDAPRRSALHAHREVTEAIREGDADAAARLMSRHGQSADEAFM
jgi:GntR family transcriptional repressor for pyruvate dehydrogenase complex